ncbi:MAG: gamma-glutamyl-gamma-aminobutyrate hydrolase family protein [Anaerolineae bacterium]|nr:gamma-glutamyl-gamma-aminobutyrate hydrolase family protein [Anaerolineae bacterium]
MSSMHPIIGIPTWSDESGRYHGAPLQALGQSYVVAVQRAGGVPVLIPLGLGEGAALALASRVDGFLLAGGGDVDPAHYGQASHPALRGVEAARDDLELLFARLTLERAIPILGICRGIQVLNVATGGTLYQDLPSERPESPVQHGCFSPSFPPDHLAHEVDLVPGSRLLGIMGQESLRVNSRHHQGIRTLGRGWVATAHAPDGLVEAIETPDHPFALGVQWHPENLLALPEHGLRLFATFVAACGAR